MSSNIIWLLQKTHLYWYALEPYLSILMCCLLTHPHTHTHIVDHTALTSRSKETCQRCSATFVNNSLNTKLIQYILQQREDKITVFEVNSLIENRDAQMRIHATSISLSLSLSWFGSIWEKGLAISNYWGDLPPTMSTVVITLIKHENMLWHYHAFLLCKTMIHTHMKQSFIFVLFYIYHQQDKDTKVIDTKAFFSVSIMQSVMVWR